MRQILIYIILLTTLSSQGQNRFSDSLTNELKIVSSDKERLELLLQLGYNLRIDDKPRAEKYIQDAYKLSLKLGDLKAEGRALRYLGLISKYDGNYPKAIHFHERALKLQTEIGNDLEIAKNYHNLSAVYHKQGNPRKAISNSESAITMAKAAKDSPTIFLSTNQLGIVHMNIGNYKKAIQLFEFVKLSKNTHTQLSALTNLGNLYYYQKQFNEAIAIYQQALKVELQSDAFRKDQLALIYNNLGSCYASINNDDSTFIYHEKALKIYEKINDKEGIARTLFNLGSYYNNIDSIKLAIEYNQKAEFIAKTINHKDLLCSILINLGSLFTEQHYYSQALTKLDSAYMISQGLKSLPQTEVILRQMAKTHSMLNNYKLAYQYLKEADSLRDILQNESISELQASYRQREQQQEIELKEKTIRSLEKEKELEETKTNLLKLVIAAGILIILIVGILIYNNQLIRKRSYKRLMERNHIIKQRNKEITSSIKYASYIQGMILPDKKIIDTLIPDSMGVFLPKDVVSGDFGWIHERDGYVLVAAVDCTGHGVPGAFMSMLGHSILNKIVDHTDDFSPGNILTLLNKEIRHALKQDSPDAKSRDGMDIALCRISPDKKRVEYAGAYNSLYIVNKNQELREIKADKAPVGGNDLTSDYVFTNNAVEADQDDVFYIFLMDLWINLVERETKNTVAKDSNTCSRKLVF